MTDSRFEPIHQQFQPVEELAVRQLETRINAKLPKEYVTFVSQYGGCGFSGDANVRVNGGSLPIFTFFDEKKLIKNLDAYSDLTTEGKFTFADDMAGNPYVLDAATEVVYFIDFSVNPPLGKRVAGSFKEFLASIEVQPFE